MRTLYPIQDDQGNGYYSTGVLPSGNQILCGQGGPDFVAVEFSSDGDYLRIFETLIPENLLERIRDRYFPYDQKAFDREFERWKEAMGLTPSTIYVKAFSMEDYRIGVQEYPEYMEEEAKAGDADALEWMEEWKASGSFVLYWGNDYFLSAEGEVESS